MKTVNNVSPVTFHSGDPAGQRQPDPRHQPLQTAGEGGDRERHQCSQRAETNWSVHF